MYLKIIFMLSCLQVSTLIAMYQIINRRDKAKEVLDTAVSFWTQRKVRTVSLAVLFRVL